MSLTAASSGFVLVLLLTVPVIQGQRGWRVTYTDTHICASEGSTVEMSCTYSYPEMINGHKNIPQKYFWLKQIKDHVVDVTRHSDYTGRVENHCDERKRCTLRIRDLRERDSAVYKLSLTTNKAGEKHTGEAGVTLSVTGLQVQVTKHRDGAELKCLSSCRPPDHSSFTWYMNGQKTGTETPSFSAYFDPSDSVSCALKGHEDFPSPPVCVLSKYCSRVFYTDRRICAFKGSSVEISCIYNSYYDVKSKFWFSPERSRRWQNPSEPEDLSKDSEYSGRVQVVETKTGRSTLRITDLTETDSAHYHFTFKAGSFEWRSSLPATTLTVTALELQVTRTITVHQSHTEAELKCLSSCSPADGLSYVWIRNREKIMKEGSSYTDRFSPGDVVSCAVKGHESHGSPPVYFLKVPSVSVNPPGEIMEGSSVTLTCSSDTDSAAKYTWYKENLTLFNKEPQLVFSSIQSSDSGEYHCAAENQLGRRTSEHISIDVEYAPELPSVSVSPSAEIVEGSSVTLTCSSDANPAANYTWYKEDEDSAKASGHIFTITDLRPEHSGNYSCKAQNTRGRHKSTLNLTVLSSSAKSAAAGSITVLLLLAIIVLSVVLFIRRRRSFKPPCEAGQAPDIITQTYESPDYENSSGAVQIKAADDILYTSVRFTKNPEALYSNIRTTQPVMEEKNEDEEDEDESVEYSTVNVKSADASSRVRREEGVEDACALYSTVSKKYRV